MDTPLNLEALKYPLIRFNKCEMEILREVQKVYKNANSGTCQYLCVHLAGFVSVSPGIENDAKSMISKIEKKLKHHSTLINYFLNTSLAFKRGFDNFQSNASLKARDEFQMNLRKIWIERLIAYNEAKTNAPE